VPPKHQLSRFLESRLRLAKSDRTPHQQLIE
jgi:hypothetical protein